MDKKHCFEKEYSKEWLEKQVKDGKTLDDMSSMTGYNRHTISKFLNIYNLGKAKKPERSKEWRSFMSKRMKGKSNAFYGKKHNRKTRKRMSENHADVSGSKNPFRKSLEDPKKREEHKKRCKDIWKGRDKEWRRKFGQKVSRILANDERFKNCKYHKHHKSGFLQTLKGGKVFYRSSWEKEVCERLDKNKDVIKFTLEGFCIKYKYNKQMRWSRVDFYILLSNDKYLLIEVKPKGLLNYENNDVKIKAYKNWCRRNKIQFCLLTSVKQIDKVIEEAIKWNYDKFRNMRYDTPNPKRKRSYSSTKMAYQ